MMYLKLFDSMHEYEICENAYYGINANIPDDYDADEIIEALLELKLIDEDMLVDEEFNWEDFLRDFGYMRVDECSYEGLGITLAKMEGLYEKLVSINSVKFFDFEAYFLESYEYNMLEDVAQNHVAVFRFPA